MFVSKTSSRHVFKTSSRRLQRNNFLSSKTSSRRLARCLQDVFKTYLQDVFKTSSRRLQDVLQDEKLLRWWRFEDVFKTCLEDVFKISSRPTNVCWVPTEAATGSVLWKRCSYRFRKIHRWFLFNFTKFVRTHSFLKGFLK